MKAKKPENWTPPTTEEIKEVISKLKNPSSNGRNKNITYTAECLGVSIQMVHNLLWEKQPMRWCTWYTLNQLESEK